jgi:hypothetical protein
MLLLVTVAAIMAGMVAASSGNAFAQGANQERFCYETELLGGLIPGTACETRVLTPSGLDINSQHFKPNTRPKDKLFDRALIDHIIEPPDQTSGLVVTPRGNATAHNRLRF